MNSVEYLFGVLVQVTWTVSERLFLPSLQFDFIGGLST